MIFLLYPVLQSPRKKYSIGGSLSNSNSPTLSSPSKPSTVNNYKKSGGGGGGIEIPNSGNPRTSQNHVYSQSQSQSQSQSHSYSSGKLATSYPDGEELDDNETRRRDEPQLTVHGIFDHHTTSTKDPIELSQEVERVLTLHKVWFRRDNTYKFIIQGDEKKYWEMDIKENKQHKQSEKRFFSEDVIEADELSMIPMVASAPRSLENLNSDASDSSDGGARDSLEADEDERGQTLSSSSQNSIEQEAASLRKKVRFQLEICHLGAKLHGLKLKRLAGDTWLYKDFCNKLISEMKL